MSEPLSRDELENWVLDLSHVALRKTALHYLDRVAELEKERDHLERDRDRWLELCGRELKRADLAEAGLAAAREAVEEYLLWRPCARGHAAAHRKLADYFRRAALARGGGQQETG